MKSAGDNRRPSGAIKIARGNGEQMSRHVGENVRSEGLVAIILKPHQ